MGFQTDTLKCLCDWLALSDSLFDWLRAQSRYQFENRPKLWTITDDKVHIFK